MAARDVTSQLLPHLLDGLEPDIEETMIFDLMQNDCVRDIILVVLSQLHSDMHHRNGNQIHRGDRAPYQASHHSQYPTTNGFSNEIIECGSTDSESYSLSQQASGPAMILSDTLTASDFHDLFRMPRSAFEELLQVLMNDPSSSINKDQMTLDKAFPKPETSLMVTLYYLGTRHTIEEVACTFQVSKTGACQSIQKVIAAISRLASIYIRWPSPERAAQIQQSYADLGSLAGVVGAVGTLSVGVGCPSCHAPQYLGPGGTPALLLQAVSDHTLSFLHCCCGWPGSIPIHRAFLDSDLYQDAYWNPEQFFPMGTFLVGGHSLPLAPWLLTPLPPGNLTGAKEAYNAKHQMALQSVDSALDLLQARFPRLQLVDIQSEGEVVQLVLVCCALHNFCRKAGDTEYFRTSGTVRTSGVELGEPVPPNLSPGGLARQQQVISMLHCF